MSDIDQIFSSMKWVENDGWRTKATCEKDTNVDLSFSAKTSDRTLFDKEIPTLKNLYSLILSKLPSLKNQIIMGLKSDYKEWTDKLSPENIHLLNINLVRYPTGLAANLTFYEDKTSYLKGHLIDITVNNNAEISNSGVNLDG